MNGVRQRNVFGREAFACDVSFSLLTGKNVEQVETWPVQNAQGLSVMCRKSIGAEYITGLLAKNRTTRFALLAVHPMTLTMMGFAMCSMYNVYQGDSKANKAHVVPVRQRTVMLDLICTDEKCKGLGKAMFRALIRVSRSTFGATLMMLEATNTAASFYADFGFRRVPDACNWPSKEQLADARREYAGQDWKYYEKTNTKKAKSIRTMAAMNKAVGPVWWKHFDRRDNGTIIMSRCLRDLPGPQHASLASWSNGATPKIGEHHRAPASDKITKLKVSEYGHFDQALKNAVEEAIRAKHNQKMREAEAAAQKAAAALIVQGRTRANRARLAAKQASKPAKAANKAAKPAKAAANIKPSAPANKIAPFEPRRPYTRSQARANRKAAMPRRSPRLKAR